MVRHSAIRASYSGRSSGTGPSTPVSNSDPSTPAGKSDPNTPVSNTAPAAKGRTPCTQEVALQCDGGLVDGCLSNLTNWHLCVEKGQNTTPCSRELALKCGAGKTDACLIDPKAAKVHVCAKN